MKKIHELFKCWILESGLSHLFPCWMCEVHSLVTRSLFPMIHETLLCDCLYSVRALHGDACMIYYGAVHVAISIMRFQNEHTRW